MERSRYLRAMATLGLIAMVALLAVAFAGCGEETTADTSAPATTTGQSTATTSAPGTTSAPASSTTGVANAQPIKIGVPVALSGFFAGDGQNSLQGVQMGVDEINAAGGVVGRQLEIVTFDTQDLAPERLMLASDTLVGKEKVDAVLTGWAGDGGDVQAFGKYEVPFIHCDAVQSAVDVQQQNGFASVFMGVETEADTGAAQAEFIKFLPYEWPSKTVSFVYSDGTWPKLVYDAIQQSLEADGWEVVSTDVAPYGTTQWDPILTKIRGLNPGLVMFDFASATDMLTFIEAFMQQPTNSILSLGAGLPIQEFQLAAAGKIDGIVGMTHVAQGVPIPPASEAQNAWYEAYTAKFGAPPGGLSGFTYIYTKMWAQAVEAVGDPSDYAAVSNYLAGNKFTVWDGISPYYFDPDHVLRSNPDYFGQMQGGKLLTLEAEGQAFTDFQGNTHEFQVPSWITP